MNNLQLKFLTVLLLFWGFCQVSCKQDSAAKTIKTDTVAEYVSKPAKKIQEQYSSTDQSINSKAAEPLLTSVKDESENSAATSFVDENAKKVEVANNVKPVPVVQEKPVYQKTIADKSKEKKAPKVRRAEIEFDELLYDFGEINQGDIIEHKFTFTNTGKAPLSITKADATCGCATPSIPFMDIMPGEKGYIGISYNSVGKEGEEFPQVTIFSNAKTDPNQVLKLKGFIKVPKKESEVVDSLKSTPIDTTKTEVGKN